MGISAMRSLIRLVFIVGVISVLGGCASSSIFTSYPMQIQPIKMQIQAKQYTAAQTTLEKHRNDADKILYMMERGRTSQLANDRKSSIEDFKQVIEAMEANEDKAIISLTDAAAQGSALLTNDNAIPYAGEAYERVFVHQYQAMNYLFSNNLEAARVEVKRAGIEQRVALNAHEDELADAEEKSRENADKNKSFSDAFAAMDAVAGKVKNSFQNAYTFYVSGVIYEMLDKPNDAYIDYKKALEIFPDNVYVQKDVLRLAKQLGMRQDYDLYKKRYPVEVVTPGVNEGEVVLFFEHGYAPIKTEVSVPIFVDNKAQKVAFPIYAMTWIEPTTLRVSVAGGASMGETSPIVYVQSMAVKALQEKLPAMLARQILRLVAKQEMAKTAGKAGGPLAQLGANIFNILSENADRRNWLTLPNDAQILRVSLPEGEHHLILNNGKAKGSITVKVVPGKKTVVRVVATEKTLHTDAVVM
ncbi:MAG: hypothetical protein COB30_001735 [Ectothiorhodospiraceae bacterium]|nr:hypothetical protein [Ectothiorhodospiraceae bacterium]